MGKDLPLFLAGEVRAWRGSRQVELRRIARVLGHEASGLPASLSRIKFRPAPRMPKNAGASKANLQWSATATTRTGPGGVVDDDGADQHVVQEPLARVEKADQEDERREHADADPVDDRMHGAEHEIGRRAVPGAHFDLHEAHAERADAGLPSVNP